MKISIKWDLEMKWKYFLSWLPGIPIAIINGTIREYGFKLYFSDLTAHQLSTFSFIILFGIYVWLILPWMKFNRSSQAIFLGMLWLILTVLFEFIFGHYVMGHSWDKLLLDYNLMEGKLWVLVLIWITVSPFIIYKMRSKIRKK